MALAARARRCSTSSERGGQRRRDRATGTTRPGHAVLHRLRDAARRGRHHRAREAHRVEQARAQALHVRRQAEDVEGGEQPVEVVAEAGEDARGPPRPSACACAPRARLAARRRPRSRSAPRARARRTSAAASSRVAWSLWSVSAATLPTTGRAAGTPSARSASRPPGAGGRSGTPSYTTRTRSAARPSRPSTSATAAAHRDHAPAAPVLPARERPAQREVHAARGHDAARAAARRPASAGGQGVRVVERGRRRGRDSAQRAARRPSAARGDEVAAEAAGRGRRGRRRARAPRARRPRGRPARPRARARPCPAAVSRTWFWPPRQPAGAVDVQDPHAGRGRRRAPAPAAWPASRRCSTR